MFDPQTQDQPLPQRLTRTLIIGAVVILVAIGGFTLIRDQFTEEEPPPPEPSAAPSPQATAQPTAPAGGDNLAQVDDWFPHSRTEFAEAGGVAADFAADVATIDYTRDDWDSHAERLGQWATDPYAVTLTTADGVAEGIWRALANDADAWTGSADVVEVTYFDPTSVTIVVQVQAEPDTGEDPTDLGEFSVDLTTNEGPGWRVDRAELLR
ncbi:hypothetical protein [Nocardiopsis tropica]|uniref:Mce-associated membrane protein n=1 Tax=Nocardiopsis tropica TaxID=109330 RepID=A0ABU7KRZ0_9ACTN|nr:hypothetical protein [Nocardiopsis umidischolae]MEE2051764.1 hypothetical protein [Nocardiopsis umidischolae]